MNDLSKLEIGDKVILCCGEEEKETVVIRKGKLFLAVEHIKKHSNYQKFRIRDGRDFGPETQNVYYLKQLNI